MQLSALLFLGLAASTVSAAPTTQNSGIIPNTPITDINEKRQSGAVGGVVDGLVGLASNTLGTAAGTVGATAGAVGSVVGDVLDAFLERILGGALGDTLQIRDDGEFDNIDKKS